MASLTIPDAVRRRFPDSSDLDLGEHRGFVIGRLLEEGDRRDLFWLFSTLGRPTIARWWGVHGGRLSLRSRAFWDHRLGPHEPTPALAQELWPLA